MRIIGRGEWGARFPNGFGSRAVGHLDKYLHHSVTQAPDLVPPFDDDFAAIRQLESIGQSRFGGGISYSFAITPAGLLFEGVSVGRIGAHTSGHNTTSVGIVLVGNYNNQIVTHDQELAVAWLLNKGVREGWWRLNTLTGGHRDTKQTACPGDNAYARIGYINSLADDNNIIIPIKNPITPPKRPPNPIAPINRLVVDGLWGPATTRRLQQVLGTPVDGVISHQWRTSANSLVRGVQWDTTAIGSTMVEALQRRIGVPVDGLLGQDTIRALQRRLGTPVDGSISSPSPMVSQLQRRLNGNTL